MKWGPRVEKLLQSIREWDASRTALQDLPGYAESHDRLEPEWFALGRLLVQEQQARQVCIDYTNWRGVRAVRRVEPRGIWFGTSRFHVGEQWFLSALDVEKQEVRDFALTSLHAWGATEEERPIRDETEHVEALLTCLQAEVAALRHQDELRAARKDRRLVALTRRVEARLKVVKDGVK
jgi:hypothetical protein